MKGELTKRQAEVCDYIASYLRGNGYSPTVREIGEHFKISSPNGVMCHLRALRTKGFIEQMDSRGRYLARSIKVIGGGDNCPCCGKRYDEQTTETEK